MPLFNERNKWVRHRSTKLLLDEDGIVHIGVPARMSELSAIVADIMKNFADEEIVLLDFAQCSTPLISSLKYKVEQVFLTETAAVFFNKLLKCVIPRPSWLEFFVTRGDLFTDGVILDSNEMRVSISNGEVLVEPHGLVDALAHANEICGFLLKEGRKLPLWKVSTPAEEKLQDLSVMQEETASQSVAVGSADELLSNEELTTEAETEEAPVLADTDDSLPQTEEEEPQSADPAPESANPFSQEEKIVAPFSEEKTDTTTSSVYERFVYRPPVRRASPPPYTETFWGGLKMVCFRDKVSSTETLLQVHQVDIYHFPKDAGVDVVNRLFEKGYLLFSGKEGTPWAEGKTLIKKELLETLSEGFQKVKQRKPDSSPRTVPAVAKGLVLLQ